MTLPEDDRPGDARPPVAADPSLPPDTATIRRLSRVAAERLDRIRWLRRRIHDARELVERFGPADHPRARLLEILDPGDPTSTLPEDDSATLATLVWVRGLVREAIAALDPTRPWDRHKARTALECLAARLDGELARGSVGPPSGADAEIAALTTERDGLLGQLAEANSQAADLRRDLARFEAARESPSPAPRTGEDGRPGRLASALDDLRLASRFVPEGAFKERLHAQYGLDGSPSSDRVEDPPTIIIKPATASEAGPRRFGWVTTATGFAMIPHEGYCSWLVRDRFGIIPPLLELIAKYDQRHRKAPEGPLIFAQGGRSGDWMADFLGFPGEKPSTHVGSPGGVGHAILEKIRGTGPPPDPALGQIVVAVRGRSGYSGQRWKIDQSENDWTGDPYGILAEVAERLGILNLVNRADAFMAHTVGFGRRDLWTVASLAAIDPKETIRPRYVGAPGSALDEIARRLGIGRLTAPPTGSIAGVDVSGAQGELVVMQRGNLERLRSRAEQMDRLWAVLLGLGMDPEEIRESMAGRPQDIRDEPAAVAVEWIQREQAEIAARSADLSRELATARRERGRLVLQLAVIGNEVATVCNPDEAKRLAGSIEEFLAEETPPVPVRPAGSDRGIYGQAARDQARWGEFLELWKWLGCSGWLEMDQGDIELVDGDPPEEFRRAREAIQRYIVELGQARDQARLGLSRARKALGAVWGILAREATPEAHRVRVGRTMIESSLGMTPERIEAALDQQELDDAGSPSDATEELPRADEGWLDPPDPEAIKQELRDSLARVRGESQREIAGLQAWVRQLEADVQSQRERDQRRAREIIRLRRLNANLRAERDRTPEIPPQGAIPLLVAGLAVRGIEIANGPPGEVVLRILETFDRLGGIFARQAEAGRARAETAQAQAQAELAEARSLSGQLVEAFRPRGVILDPLGGPNIVRGLVEAFDRLTSLLVHEGESVPEMQPMQRTAPGAVAMAPSPESLRSVREKADALEGRLDRLRRGLIALYDRYNPAGDVRSLATPDETLLEIIEALLAVRPAPPSAGNQADRLRGTLLMILRSQGVAVPTPEKFSVMDLAGEVSRLVDRLARRADRDREDDEYEGPPRDRIAAFRLILRSACEARGTRWSGDPSDVELLGEFGRLFEGERDVYPVDDPDEDPPRINEAGWLARVPDGPPTADPAYERVDFTPRMAVDPAPGPPPRRWSWRRIFGG